MARTVEPAVSDVDAQILGHIADSVRGTFKTVEDMTQAFIREAITQGIFRPGQRLNLDSIAESLGVSRMPVRASLRQLENEGLVQINHYRGATVSVLRPSEIAEIYELRILLESYLLKLAIASIDDELVDRLEAIVREMEDAVDGFEQLALSDVRGAVRARKSAPRADPGEQPSCRRRSIPAPAARQRAPQSRRTHQAPAGARRQIRDEVVGQSPRKGVDQAAGHCGQRPGDNTSLGRGFAFESGNRLSGN
jgi:Mn-dependent DtxR family transcriptional regulator